MPVRLWMMVNDNLIELKRRFLQHIGKEVLVNVVVQVPDCDFDGWRLSDVLLVDCKPASGEKQNSM